METFSIPKVSAHLFSKKNRNTLKISIKNGNIFYTKRFRLNSTDQLCLYSS